MRAQSSVDFLGPCKNRGFKRIFRSTLDTKNVNYKRVCEPNPRTTMLKL